MEVDFRELGERLTKAGMTGKPVDQYSKKEVETLVAACIDALIPTQHTETVVPPYIDANGRLVVPLNSDPRFWWWKGGGQSLLETLREIKAPESVVRKYVKIEEGTPF